MWRWQLSHHFFLFCLQPLSDEAHKANTQLLQLFLFHEKYIYNAEIGNFPTCILHVTLCTVIIHEEKIEVGKSSMYFPVISKITSLSLEMRLYPCPSPSKTSQECVGWVNDPQMEVKPI